ncbi:hypothetical protein TrVE_jg4213 [Triparma verrucosa]|uniref:Uncharacterized protein n=1 Tax=Triparma verrucosa TaxID=1606542 RepID=A0A9W7BV09_9STRA|nr:hypothetical protein TrVE_jg4213 [Triparma verrucosa]
MVTTAMLAESKAETKADDDPRSPKGSARSLVKSKEATHGPSLFFRASFTSDKSRRTSHSSNTNPNPNSSSSNSNSKNNANNSKKSNIKSGPRSVDNDVEKFMDTTNLKILDATETTLTFSLPPVSAKTVIQFKPYGADWGLEGVGGEVEVTQGGEITIESLLPAETYVVRVIVEGKPQGEELVVDTGVPGCSGSSGKKKRRGCVIS